MAEDTHILVCGCGSVGKRHARNLQSLGARISGIDPREDRRAEFASEIDASRTYDDLSRALAGDPPFDAVVIASPTAAHVVQASAAVDVNLPVLLEKPVAPDLAFARALSDRLERSRVPLLLGYTWRWWPAVNRIKALLDAGAAGRLRHVRFTMSAHLADWHPWERYQDWFMSSRAQGGGAILDESHWIDLALWFFGMPDAAFGRIETISGLEIDSDDNVDALLVYETGLRVSLHLDLYGRPHERSIRFVGDEATILWSAEDDRILVGRDMAGYETLAQFDNERNDMFLAVAREFLDIVNHVGKPSCTLADGLRVLEVIEALRASSDQNRVVSMSEFVTR